MKNAGGTFTLALVALAGLSIGPSAAHADADYVLFAGTSRGANTDQLTAIHTPSCTTCPASATGVPMTIPEQAPSLAMLGVGLVGAEGYKRGGGEIFTILGLGNQQTTGYTSFTTFAGVTGERLFAQVGLGLGKYWGGVHTSLLASFAGNARAEIGVHLTERWIVVGRGDIVANNHEVSPFLTLGLQFLPYAR